MDISIQGSPWFRRLYKECCKLSPHLRFVRVKFGFYRIYWKQAYIHEVYKEMPEHGYDITNEDPRFESEKYYAEFEDQAEITRKIKNYVEGYHDSIDNIRTRVWMMRNDKEFNEEATKAYRTLTVK